MYSRPPGMWIHISPPDSGGQLDKHSGVLQVSWRSSRQSSWKMATVVVERWLLWLLALLQAASTYGSELSSEACRELGFSTNLLCSSCDLLSQFSLKDIELFCKQCCQEEAKFESKKLYAGAILEVCG